MTAITVKGAVLNVAIQVATDASLTVPAGMSDQNCILAMAAEAGITLVYVESDQNMIERLAAALGVKDSLSLTGAYAGLFGASPATVDGWTFSIVGGADGTKYLATTDPAKLLAMWETGVRLFEAQDTTVSGKRPSIGFGNADGSVIFSVQRTNGAGAAGDTHWRFVAEVGGVTQNSLEVAAAVTDLPAIGIDGATGDAIAWIAGVQQALPAEFDALFDGEAGVGLFGDIDDTGAGGASMTLAVDVAEFGYAYPGAFDVYGNAAG